MILPQWLGGASGTKFISGGESSPIHWIEISSSFGGIAMYAVVHEIVPIVECGPRRLLRLRPTDRAWSLPQLILDDVITILEDQPHLLRRDHEPYFRQHCCSLQ